MSGRKSIDLEVAGPRPAPATIICANHRCRNEFAPHDKRQKYCCARCRLVVAQERYNAKPSVRAARKERDRRRWLDPIERKGKKALHEMWRLDQEERLASDPEYYAKIRARRRETRRRQNDKHRKIPYRQYLSRRIPDCYCKGELMIDTRSQFMPMNLTDSQKAFSRDLAIERKEYRVNHNIM